MVETVPAIYREVMGLVSDAAFVDLDGRIAFANARFLTLVGATHEEQVLGHSPLDFIHPASRPLVHERIRTLHGTVDQVESVEEQWMRLDGSVVLATAVARVVPWGEGRAIQVVLRDLTDQLAHQASDALVAALVATAVDAILVVDTRGTVELFNPAAEQLLGYHADEVIGHNVSMLMPEPDASRHDGYMRHYLATGEARIIGIGREVEARRKNGSTVPVKLAVSEMHFDGQRKFAGFLHDLSAQRQAERALREQESVARMGQMAAVVAHEVKNPLAGLSGALQVMRAQRAADDPDATLIDEMLNRLRALNRLVDDMLVFTRPVQLDAQRVSAGALVERAVGALRADPQVARHDVRVSVPHEPAVVNVDPALIEALLTNLVLNAAQAMMEPGRIDITASVANNECRVTVADTGPGIRADLSSRVFEPFVTSKKGGTGLGLAISRRTARLHGGDLVMESSRERGAAFSLTLPMLGSP